MGETLTLGELDRKLVAALQVNGRASWKQVARAVDATESTVARRGQQLLQAPPLHLTQQRALDQEPHQ